MTATMTGLSLSISQVKRFVSSFLTKVIDRLLAVIRQHTNCS